LSVMVKVASKTGDETLASCVKEEHTANGIAEPKTERL
jgi:hypothetical protein